MAVGAALASLSTNTVARGAIPSSVRLAHGCYLVGEPVSISGAGFAPLRPFTVSVDGVYFGQSTTDRGGGFATSLLPGGLPAGVAQHVDDLDATDGTSVASVLFTVTRKPGARFLAARGNPRTLRAPWEVWGFSRNGRRVPIYLHYIGPRGHLRSTTSLGLTTGQCGYMRTGRNRLFPFVPRPGTWTLQIDTTRTYSRRPAGPLARIGVRITGP